MVENIKLISKPKDHKKGYKVYGIFDPNEKIPRYIGVTENSLLTRLGTHLMGRHRTDKQMNDLLGYWLNYVEISDRVPEIRLIKTFEYWNHALAYEGYLINKYWNYICNISKTFGITRMNEIKTLVEERLIDRKKEAKPFGFTVNKTLRKLPFTKHPHLKRYLGE